MRRYMRAAPRRGDLGVCVRHATSRLPNARDLSEPTARRRFIEANWSTYGVRISSGIVTLGADGQRLPKLPVGTLLFGAALSGSPTPYPVDYRLGFILDESPDDIDGQLSILWGYFEDDEGGMPIGRFVTNLKGSPISWGRTHAAFWRRLVVVGHVSKEIPPGLGFVVEWECGASSPPCFFGELEAVALAHKAANIHADLRSSGRGAKRRLPPADATGASADDDSNWAPGGVLAGKKRAVVNPPASVMVVSHASSASGASSSSSGVASVVDGLEVGTEGTPASTVSSLLRELAGCIPLLQQRITGGPMTSCRAIDLATLLGLAHPAARVNRYARYSLMLGHMRQGRLPQEAAPGAQGGASLFGYSLCVRRWQELRRLVLDECILDYSALRSALDRTVPLDTALARTVPLDTALARDAPLDTALARDGPIDTALVMAHAPAAPLAPLCESSRRVSSHLKGSGCSKCRWEGCRWCQDAVAAPAKQSVPRLAVSESNAAIAVAAQRRMQKRRVGGDEASIEGTPRLLLREPAPNMATGPSQLLLREPGEAASLIQRQLIAEKPLPNGSEPHAKKQLRGSPRLAMLGAMLGASEERRALESESTSPLPQARLLALDGMDEDEDELRRAVRVS